MKTLRKMAYGLTVLIGSILTAVALVVMFTGWAFIPALFKAWGNHNDVHWAITVPAGLATWLGITMLILLAWDSLKRRL